MRNDELDAIWADVEVQSTASDRYYQRLVYIDLMYRAYIGATGFPSKRFLSIEIPISQEHQFDSFTAPQGFTLSIGTPSVQHEGYSACILQASESDQNDVFTIVAKDVLDDLSKQKSAAKYIEALKHRIEKWRQFFKNPPQKKLADKTVIGLIGELTFIKELIQNGIVSGADLWNGPIKASQDFQGNTVAIEVKTSSTNSVEYVHISSEIQLDEESRNALFLVVYRVERNDVGGVTLPDLITEIKELLTEQQAIRFQANLTCLGYLNENAALYSNGYAIKEQMVFRVYPGFPRLLRNDLPKGITDITYQVSISACEPYEATMDDIVMAIKEYEYGEGGGAD